MSIIVNGLQKRLCEWCGKDFYVKESVEQRFCSCSCSAKWRCYTFPELSKKYWTDENRKKQSEVLTKRNLNPTYNKILRKRMEDNNPSFNKDTINKANSTKIKNNTVGFKGKYSKNRGGNGKFTVVESKCYVFLSSLGFLYNYAINTREVRLLYPDKHIAYNYKPDFVNLRHRLCVEIDGKSHNSVESKSIDEKKEFVLNELGYEVIRYSNEFIVDNFDLFKVDIITKLGYTISEVKEVTAVENKEYMYDLEVEENHNYFANNVLVHNCKNTESQQGIGVLRLDGSASKMAMTGTLLVNDPQDLYAPMKLIGLINYDKWYFEKQYMIKDDWGQIAGFKNMDDLHNILYKSSLRRTKDLLTLPDKMYMQEWLEMSNEERSVFNQVTGNEKPFNLEKIDYPKEMVAIITRMRQATVAAELLTDRVKKSTKFDRLNDILEEAKSKGQKVLVFCPFTEALKLGLEYCKEYNPKLICGGMGNKVQEVVDEHENTNGFSVIFAQEATLGVGYTLVNTNIVVFLSPPWNEANYEQCSDRCYRIGQKNTVQVIDLLAKDTYDELLYQKLHGKGAMAKMLIDGNEDEVVKQYIKEAGIIFNKEDVENEESSGVFTLLDGLFK